MSLSDILIPIFFALWVFLPAGAGNVAPIFAARLNIPFLKDWNTPLDLGHSFRGKRIFGQNKTWRGLVSGMVLATITLALQQYAFEHSSLLRGWITGVDYANLPTLIVGPLFGFGALAGDAIKSFFKRQRGIAAGDSWYPFDQIDLPVGALAATWPFIHPTLLQCLLVILLWWVTQLISTHIGFLLNLKDKPI